MSRLKKFFICIFLSLLIVSSCVFATNTNLNTDQTVPANDSSTTATTAVDVNEDLYVYNTEYCSIGDNVIGNVFASVTKLVINPRNNGGSIAGDLFAIANELNIESDVTYSNNKDKNGNYIIDKINHKSIIEGNVYAFSDYFTLEAGSEIHGDLYVYATTVNIEQDALIDGNMYIYADTINFNGQLTGSAYISSINFNMNYFGYITRDLYVNSQNVTLAGVVYRNVFVTADDKLVTLPDFITYKNLTVNSANEFTFSGEVQGDAKINVATLNIKNIDNDTAVKCSIKGNLEYAVKENVTIPDGIVLGKTTTSTYVDRSADKFDFGSALIDLLTFLVYVSVIILLAKFIAPKCIEQLPKLSFSNILASFGIGFASLFAIFILFILLLLSGIATTLAFVVLLAYLFIFALGLPLLILNIANTLKLKMNLVLKVLIVASLLYLISLIPVLGPFVMFITLFVGLGRIILKLFFQKK